MNKREIGARGEDRAVGVLEEKGYRILERNFRCRFGEIDVIAEHQGYLVFVEVKFRSEPGCFEPAEAVTAAKQRRICRTADYYRVRHRVREDVPCRFDVVAETSEGVRVYENAFAYRG